MLALGSFDESRPMGTDKLECLTTCSSWKYVNVTTTNVKRMTSIGWADDSDAIRRSALRTLKLISVGGREGEKVGGRVGWSSTG